MNINATTKETMDYLIEYWWVFIGIMFLIISKGRLGIQTTDKAVYLFSLWCLAFTFLKLGFTAIRNSTPKIVSNPIHTTTTGRWTPIGNYVVLRAGGLRAGGIEWELNEGTIVIPKDAVNVVGEHITLMSRLEQVEENRLPPQIRKLLSQMKWKPPYFFGLADEIQQLKNPELTFYKDEIENLNAANEQLTKMLQDSGRTVEDVLSSRSRISMLSKRESILDKLKKSVTKSEDEI